MSWRWRRRSIFWSHRLIVEFQQDIPRTLPLGRTPAGMWASLLIRTADQGRIICPSANHEAHRHFTTGGTVVAGRGHPSTSVDRFSGDERCIGTVCSPVEEKDHLTNRRTQTETNEQSKRGRMNEARERERESKTNEN